MSTYAASDWHGNYWVWEKVKTILSPNDKLYFLGDAADRGHDGWKLIKELLADPRVIYLKGNHEDLLVNGLREYPKEDILSYDGLLWFHNGGEPTYRAFCEDNNIEEKLGIVKQLKELPFCANYINNKGTSIFLCHAGCDGDDIDFLDEYRAIWDRSHFIVADTWYGNDNTIIIHGHTPIMLMLNEQKFAKECCSKEIEMPDYTDGAYWYAKGHKVCIDMGTPWENKALLLNLDTFAEIIFINK